MVVITALKKFVCNVSLSLVIDKYVRDVSLVISGHCVHQCIKGHLYCLEIRFNFIVTDQSTSTKPVKWS